MLNKRKGLIILIFALILSTSCKKEFTTIGNQLIDTPHFEGKLFDEAKVVIYDQPVDRVFASQIINDFPHPSYLNLPYASLGFYNDDKFGLLNAAFATTLNPDEKDFSKDLGDNINILSSKLIIPYFSHTEDEAYVLDSIYGDSTLDIQIHELTYLLPGYDPDSNLEEKRVFYSDFDFTPYKGTLIGEANAYEINNEPYYIYKRNDDGTFELDDDGEKIVKDSLSPGLVIDLDNNFFQQKIFDHSGEDVLSNTNMFRDYFRGLYIEALESGETDRFLMLPLDEAKILIEYTYDEVDDNGTPNYPNDDTVETKYNEIEMSFAPPYVNHYQNTLSPEAQTALNNSDIVNGDEKIYIKGDAGAEALVQLFDEQQLRELRESDWMINQAELYIYVDENEAQQMLSNPERLYIYNYDKKYFIDDAITKIYPDNYQNNYLTLDGHLKKDDNGQAYYKFGITRHIRNVIKNDSLNARLAIRVVPETYPDSLKIKDVFLDPDAFLPAGTVLHGNLSAVKPPVLKIYYTDPK